MRTPETVAALFPSKTLNQSLFIFDEISSTNTFALELAKRSAPQGTLILADRQTAGRGRLQRSWHSPPHTNIYASLIFSLDSPFQSLGWIPLMAGIVIAQTIEARTTISMMLKWPNDLLINDQKVGGILCESFKKNSTELGVVIGFGLNVNLSESAFPKDLKDIATSLQIHTQHPLDRDQLLQSIVPALEQGWQTLITQGPQSCQLAYSQRCSTLGKQISVQFPDGRMLKGIAHLIGNQGQLQVEPSPSDLVRQSASIVEVHVGDVYHIR